MPPQSRAELPQDTNRAIITTILNAAFSALGVMYRWGGNSLATGVDCSGLVQQAFLAAGYQLPRVSAALRNAGQRVSMDQLRPGDLITYNTGTRNDAAYGAGAAEHVAIYIGNGKMIEAPGRGRPVRVTNVRAGGVGTRIVGVRDRGTPQAVQLGPSGQTWTANFPATPDDGLPLDGDFGSAPAYSYTGAAQDAALAANWSSGVQAGESIEDAARRLYGYLGWFLDHPEIGPILKQAAEEGWDQNRLMGALYGTNWWKTTAEAARVWDALLASDPAEAEAQITARVAEVRDLAMGIGLNLDDDTLRELATGSLRFGIDVNSAQFRDTLASNIPAFGEDQDRLGFGAFQATIDEIKRLAFSEYMVGIPEADAYRMAQQVIAGDLTMDGIKAQFNEIAHGRFAHIADALDRGVTPGQYFAPYRNMIADELEISADQIDLMSPEWSRVTGYYTKDGMRPMTFSEAQRFVRNKPEWAKTSKAKGLGASMARQLAESMAVAAF